MRSPGKRWTSLEPSTYQSQILRTHWRDALLIVGFVSVVVNVVWIVKVGPWSIALFPAEEEGEEEEAQHLPGSQPIFRSDKPAVNVSGCPTLQSTHRSNVKWPSAGTRDGLVFCRLLAWWTAGRPVAVEILGSQDLGNDRLNELCGQEQGEILTCDNAKSIRCSGSGSSELWCWLYSWRLCTQRADSGMRNSWPSTTSMDQPEVSHHLPTLSRPFERDIAEKAGPQFSDARWHALRWLWCILYVTCKSK